MTNIELIQAGLPPAKEPMHGGVFVGLGLLSIVLAALILFADLPSVAIGSLAVVLLLTFMLLGIPVGFSMILAAGISLFALGGWRVVEASTAALMYDSVSSWSLTVVPMFVVMGVAMWKGGITTRAYAAASQWFGWMPGGLAVATNFAGAGMAASSGSTVGITYALGKIAVPEMLRHGYSANLAVGTVAMAGTLGQVIPPSILLVVYAGAAETPVGPQLLAGVLPGILLASGFALIILLWAAFRPTDAPRSRVDSITWDSRFRSLVGVIPIAVVALVVLGGMFTGVFTASESAAFGAIAAIFLGWVSVGKGNRGPRATWVFIRTTLMESIASIAGLFIVITGAYFLSRVIAVSGLAREMTNVILDLQPGRIELLLFLILFYIVLGMFLESIPMILLTVPLFIVPLEALGVDMIWFGVFIIIMCEIGMVFPPIGMLTFIVHRIVQDPAVNLGDPISLPMVFKGVMPFVAVAIGVAVLLILFPEVVLWLPNATPN